VSVLDADGRTVPTADDQITFTLTGKGSVIGVDNGRLESHESYKGMKRAAFNGLALVLLQSNGMPGSMRLLAESGSLSPAEIVITAD
jgi:beta-galactosidase